MNIRKRTLLCVLLTAAAELARASVKTGEDRQLTLTDEEALMPTAGEAQAAEQAWVQRTARSSPDEKTDHIRALLSNSLRSSRRSTQDTDALPNWKYESSLLRGALYTELDLTLAEADATTACSDVLATNIGALEPCSYECTSLKQHFFSTSEGECFIVEQPTTATWPSELTSKRQDILDWELLLNMTSDIPAAFEVGSGSRCVNVTIQSTVFGTSAESTSATHEETRCLQPGHHTHNPHFTEAHGVEIVGYANITHDPSDPDATYSFVIGDCTDTIVRVQTTGGSSDVITWQIDDGAHNGPWYFDTQGVPGVYEHPSCMFDNSFTLSRHVGGADWTGTVSVVSTVEDKTIVIPPNENWILQGAEVNGVPTALDARLKSGEAYPSPGTMSYANIVVRYVRFTSQRATLDPYADQRSHSTGAPTRLGGALSYTGGWGATIIFEKCVFDHLFASSGGAIFIDGQMDEWARDPDLNSRPPEELTLTIRMLDCLAWQNEAVWVGGTMRVVDAYPLNVSISDTQFVDNFAAISSAVNFAIYSSIFDKDADDVPVTGVKGQAHYDLQRIEVTGVSPAQEADDGTRRYEQSPLAWVGFGGHWPVGPGTDRPDVKSVINIGQLQCHDVHMSAQPCIIAYHIGECAGGCWEMRLADSEFYNAYGFQTTAPWSSHLLTWWAETLEVSRTRFENVGLDTDVHDAVCMGVVSSSTSRLSRFVNISVTNGYSAHGGALAIGQFGGRGLVEIIGSVFRGNRALVDGGALYNRGKGLLLIQNSQFLMNEVRFDSEVHVDIVVHVYTGSSGAGSTSLPVWKLDGQEPSHDDGSCGDDIIYGNSSYSVGSTYAQVLTTTTGPHTLWHGLVLNDPNAVQSWAGGGWIDIMGIQPKVYPEIFDNRATAGSDGRAARAPGCYQGTVTEDSDLNYCPTGQAFWTFTRFEVPYGFGGAIAATGEGAVEIRDSVFTDNEAGRGSSMSTIGSSNLKVVGTTFASSTDFMKNVYMDSVPPYECASHPCDPGYGCSFSQLSLFCTQCGADQFSTDGRQCRSCEPGTQSSGNRTGCLLCPDGTFSSAGLCQRCAVGRVSSEDRKTCVDCPVGKAAGLGIACEPCGPSHFASAGQLFCEECPPGETHTTDHSGCIPCAVTGDFAGTTAQPVRATGAPRCTLCQDGSVASTDGVSCVPCSQPGQVSVSGLACTDCAVGTQPNANRTRCQSCPEGTAGVDGVCTPCSAGKQVSPGASSCADCPPGRHSADGTACVACPPGSQPNLDQSTCESCLLYENAFSVAGTECVQCPSRETPNSDRTACVCTLGHYPLELYGEIDCVDESGISDDGNIGLLDLCAMCPSCLSCDDLGKVNLKPGWAFYGARQAYRCPVDAGCPGGPIPNVSAALLTWIGESYSKPILDAQCAVGYTGPICGSCDGDWNHLRVGKPCEPCDDGVLNVSMALSTLAAAFVACGLVISGLFRVLKDNGVVTDARLIVGFYQMLSQMSGVIDFEFPAPVPGLAELVKILFLDLRNIIKLDCWDVGGLDGKVTTNLVVVPLLFVSACFALRANQRRTIGLLIKGGAADESAYTTADVQLKNNLFVGVFLLYPTITSTLFRIPQCRQVGDSWFHEDDFGVECKGAFFGFVAFAIVIIILIPVGVPVLLFFFMRSKKNRIGGVRMTALGGAKLADDETEDENDSFGFLIRDMKPEYWYLRRRQDSL